MRRLILTLMAITVAIAAYVPAADARPESPRLDRRKIMAGPTFPYRGGSLPAGKSLVDTQYIYGGPGTDEGKFETAYGPDWMGWTHVDLIETLENHWHISTYYAANLNGHGPGNRAMWCGDSTLAACSPSDSVGGVASNMFDDIVWEMPATDPLDTTTVHITAYVNYDLVDAGWDFLELWVKRSSGEEMLGQWTGTADNLFLDLTTTILPGEYWGPNGDQVKLIFRVWSDSGWDDEDCLSPSHGACQIDDITVYLDGLQASFDDFEAGSPVNWTQEVFSGVGDFAALRSNLDDLDPCRDNHSVQVSFIDDGVVVPGTGGSPCITWCYGPGGYIVNNTGGLLADDARDWFLHNQIISPPIAWTPGLDAATYLFDVYRHETLCSSCPGMFFEWFIRSTDSPDLADLESQPWKSRNFVYYGGPDYARFEEPVTDLLVANPQFVQLALGVNELGWAWGWNGLNGTPAPYFDNVALQAWKAAGPEILLQSDQVFTDAFVESGVLDPANPAANSCRLDTARDVTSNSSIGVSDRGDSLLVNINPRSGGILNGEPVLHWVLHPNTGFAVARGALRGSTPGRQEVDYLGDPVIGKFSFDLPDSGFFFPGDILHYYITAQDDLGGEIGMTVWPADTTSVLDFLPSTSYPSAAEVRALPTLTGPVDGSFTQPHFLVVDSAGDQDHTERLLSIFRELAFELGSDFDLFTVENKASDQQQGLAGVAPAGLLASYSSLMYDLGQGFSNVWASNFSYTLKEPGALNTWLASGGKKLLVCGNNAVSNLSGTEGTALMTNQAVSLIDDDLSIVNGGARDLQISPVAGNGVIPDAALWRVNGGCPGLPSLDALAPDTGGVSLATLDPLGAPGGTYAAVVAREDLALSNRLLTVPFDLMRVQSPADGYTDGQAMSGRARFLGELLDWLSLGGTGVSPVPTAESFAVAAYPNPFNPVTTLSFTMPKAGHLSLRIFDLRGSLVRQLIDGRQEKGAGKAIWDGLDESGSQVSSGVYFYQARTEGEVKVGKITMIK